MPIRSPIIVVVGHVDHGKSTLLDMIRHTTVQISEAGGITQCIGATDITANKIKEVCGTLLEKMNIQLEIPGLLAIDTPGHEAFTNLRKRGGSIADLAILVIDITQGVQPQTKESIEILRQFKVPFVIAANKIDLIPNWKPQKTLSYLESLANQKPEVKNYIEKKVYGLMAEFGNYGMNCDLFNKVDDFTQNIAVIPCSGVTGEGISELLMMISGLAQKYLKKKLQVSSGHARGSILEVKNTVGLGTTIDAIIYDGILKKNQFLIVGGVEKPFITKIRVLLKPCELQEIRDKKCCFSHVTEVIAAKGIRISAPELENSIAGMPVQSADNQKIAQQIAKEMQKEIAAVLSKNDSEGIIVKADSLGSLEALTGFLKKSGIMISSNGIGDIGKIDVINCSHMKQKNLYNGIILGFNVKINDEAVRLALENDIKIVTSNIIYHLLDKYNEWKGLMMEEKKRKELGAVALPGKLKVMGEFIFRKSKPAVVGVNVISGSIKPGVDLMKENGEIIGNVKQLQNQSITIQTAKAGDKIACSIDGATYEKDFFDNEILYVSIPEKDFLRMKKGLISFMAKSEVELLKEIALIQRKSNPLWGL
ncbi:MAG: translation initiation factor IF-2 [Candidatus Nanoarchaeia archaeon]|nr:translation initiation factor IF-2 [Candidatus Nanoarchaeia archaeon]